ncbi:MAG: right-handed parallel beta-helix repeat-containing protein [Acidimicrobiales bacterium]
MNTPQNPRNARSRRGVVIACCLAAGALFGVLALRTGLRSGGEYRARGETVTTTARGTSRPDGAATNDRAGASSPQPVPTTTTPSAASAGLGVTWPHATFEVSDPGEWDDAVRAARPGDVIRLVATIGRPLSYRGSSAPRADVRGGGGTAARPLTITAASGVWIDPGDTSNDKPGLDVMYTSHVNVVGVNVRNSQFGIRVQNSTGTAAAPIRVADNQVTDIGHAGIHVGGDVIDHTPSRHVTVEANTVSRTGRTAPEYGEGIYIGYGGREWADTTSDVTVVDNEIAETGAEGVDIKPGTRNITVEDNRIHDLSPLSGGAISAHYVGEVTNPDLDRSGNIMIRGNRIWNITLDGRPGSNNWAIWVGHGGVTITENLIWGLRDDPGATRAVRVRSPMSFGPNPIVITDNVFWTATGWVAEGQPAGAGLVQASGNRGPAGADGVETPIEPPGAPALGRSGPADAGAGPGSVFNQSLGASP